MNKKHLDGFGFDTYISPFTWRYGSGEMRTIFSEKHKYELWRKIWVALAAAQQKKGLVSTAELEDLQKHEKDIDIARIFELEKETQHDVMAAIKEFGERAPIGAGKIHMGATSMDIVDNADTIKVQEALRLVHVVLQDILRAFAKRIEAEADHVCMGYTHLQPAEPTTIGYRFAFYAQELLLAHDVLAYALKSIKTKGFKGAVGTQASYFALMNNKQTAVTQLEEQVLSKLGLTGVTISSQVHTRLYDYMILTALAMVSSACAKFAADVRLMQAPGIGEWAEPFGKKQVGSSAMPFKKNPILSEKICSLARLIAEMPSVALGNARHSYLERTLDDSANKRLLMPEAFLVTDEILRSSLTLIEGLQIFPTRVTYHLTQYGPFAATEAILMEAVKKGADRQKMHEVLREVALIAWDNVAKGLPSGMETLLYSDARITTYVSRIKLTELLDPASHVGTAPVRARALARQMHTLLPKKR